MSPNSPGCVGPFRVVPLDREVHQRSPFSRRVSVATALSRHGRLRLGLLFRRLGSPRAFRSCSSGKRASPAFSAFPPSWPAGANRRPLPPRAVSWCGFAGGQRPQAVRSARVSRSWAAAGAVDARRRRGSGRGPRRVAGAVGAGGLIGTTGRRVRGRGKTCRGAGGRGRAGAAGNGFGGLGGNGSGRAPSSPPPWRGPLANSLMIAGVMSIPSVCQMIV